MSLWTTSPIWSARLTLSMMCGLLLDELENLFRSYWTHRLGVSDGLLQVLRHNVRVKTQEVRNYQLEVPEQCVSAPV